MEIVNDQNNFITTRTEPMINTPGGECAYVLNADLVHPQSTTIQDLSIAQEQNVDLQSKLNVLLDQNIKLSQSSIVMRKQLQECILQNQ